MPIAANRENNAARALWIEGPRQAALRSAALASPAPAKRASPCCGAGSAAARSGSSSRGAFPPAKQNRMRAPFQEGEFSFPVKYGYCAVGRVEAGPAEWLGRTVFCLHPHQNRFIAPLDMLRPVPGRRSAAARDARRQYGDRAQRAVGFGRGAGRPHRRDRRRRRRPAGRGACRAPARRGGDGRRYSTPRARNRRRFWRAISSPPPNSPRGER